MDRFRGNVRRPVTLVLAIGMAMAVNCTGSVLRTVQAKSPVPIEIKCCCGTPDGRCCGGPCCEAPTAPSTPTSPPLRSGTEQSESVVLALLKSASEFATHPTSQVLGHACVDPLGWIGACSLQTRHVRIQT